MFLRRHRLVGVVVAFSSCLLLINSISSQLQPIREDGVKIGLKNYEIIDAYFQLAIKLTIYDFTENDNGFVTDLLKSAFDDYSVTVVYHRPSSHLAPTIQTPRRGNLEFVFRDYNYDVDDYPHYCIPDWVQEGVIMFHDSNIGEMLTFLEHNLELITASNLMTIFTGECNQESTILFGKILNHFHRHYAVPYHLALKLRCSVLTFFDLLEYDAETKSWGKLIWLELNKIKDVKSAVSSSLGNYKKFPVKVAMFDRPPTAISIDEVNQVRYPLYLRKMRQFTSWTGIDYIVLFHVQEKLNFTLEIKKYPKHDFGFKNTDGSFVGTLGAVINEDVDISFNGRFVKDYETNGVLGFLHYVSFDRICFITPKAQRVPTWMAPLLIFHVEAWVALFGIVWINGLFWYLLRQLFGDSHQIILKGRLRIKFEGRDGFPALFLDAATMLLSNIRDKLPSNTPERMFIATILFSATYMTGIIQAALTSSFSTVSFYKEIDTFEDLVKTSLPIYTSRSIGDLLGDETEIRPVVHQLQRQLVIYDTNVIALPHTATYRNVCGVEREADAEILIKSEYSTAEGEPLLHVMKECPRVYYLGYITRLNWPFAPDINRIISYFYESGLIRKWYDDIKHTLVNESSSIDLISYSPFHVHNLVFSFYLLFVGLMAAVVVFIMEIVAGKGLSMKKNNKIMLVKRKLQKRRNKKTTQKNCVN